MLAAAKSGSCLVTEARLLLAEYFDREVAGIFDQAVSEFAL
jgi:hypothetical protein